MRKSNKQQVIHTLKKFREALRDFLFFHENKIVDGSYFTAEFRLNETLKSTQDFISTLEKGKALTNDHILFLHELSSLARTHNIISAELNAFTCDAPYRPIGEDELSSIESFRRDCEDARARPKRCAYTTRQFQFAMERLNRGERLTVVCASIAPRKPKAFEISLRHWFQSQYGKRFSVKRLQGKA